MLDYSFLSRFFDGIYLLTTIGSKRKEEAKQRLVDYNLNFVNIIETKNLAETTEGTLGFKQRIGNLACAASHRLAIQVAKEKGEENILVLEDDFLFFEENVKELESALAELKKIQQWKFFNLGGIRFDFFNFGLYDFEYEAVGEHLVRAKNLSATHAIAYNKRCYDDILINIPPHEEILPNHHNYQFIVPFDLWVSWQNEYYTGRKPFAYQPGDESEIGNIHSGVKKHIENTYKSFDKIDKK